MAARPEVWSEVSVAPSSEVSAEENTVSVVVPSGAYTDVVRLVTAGFVSQIGFGFEAIDDVQLAIELLLHSVPAQGERVTVTLASSAAGLKATVTSFDEGALRRHLGGDDSTPLDLISVIQRLVDSVEVVEGPEAAVVLRKQSGAIA